jgi:hypothetical protein
VGALMAMVQRAGRQPGRRRGARMVHRPPAEGPATPEERQLLRGAACSCCGRRHAVASGSRAAGGARQAGGPSCCGLAELRAAVAIDAARCVHAVHRALDAHAAAAVGLPPGIAAVVARAAVTAVDDAARRRLCGCALAGRHSLRWESGGAAECDAAGACIVCARCGKLIRATVWPRVRQPGGDSHRR